jgi:hypothetical protein
VDGEKAKVATRLIRRINTTYLARILGVDCVEETYFPCEDEVGYVCITEGKEVCSMKFSDLTPLEDRITAMLVLIRIEHGNHSEGKGGSTP